ncbi:SDR family oxidoreductase [Pseudochrobactrum asaccharolyticum]|uniref:NAD(P)-dependent dehydrogenase (Short-subunit alcohol dehydrogenase family) n=1 Tax=Pseudochrobactrum asaccharolyticum TaxID=354351 RepID=A0A366DHZ0_9HYPH|nr:SDR family oxidoreductase [Pseudochrobactrum asaccharolyticum]RBO89641.1 NAD(P)-dependent dehydrogenase (short-subunit alcohol dehydrogenase family) [Pseudochrobactrum asaccharolyticum]
MRMLENKVAIITGASSGIGRAAALLFSAEGAAVVLNARGEKGLQEVAEEIRFAGGQVSTISGDVKLMTTHERLVREAEKVFGGVDIAFNNAATIGPVKPLADVAYLEWEDTVAATLTSAFLGARSQIPAMLKRGGGSIVFTSSFVGTSVGLPGMGVYAAAKSALMGLVKGVTADYAAQGIRANALMAGGTDTAMAGDSAQKEWAAGLHAMKRIAQPEEIAKAALFLASPMASFVAGSALFADGGNSAVKL